VAVSARPDDSHVTPGSVDDQAPAVNRPGSGPARRPARRVWPGYLFLGVLALYLFTAAGQFQTVDAAQELGVAVSLRHGNGVRSDFPIGAAGGTSFGRNGHAYAGHDIGSSLLYLPFTLIPGTVEHRATRSADGTPTAGLVPNRRLYFAASFLAPLLGALIGPAPSTNPGKIDASPTRLPCYQRAGCGDGAGQGAVVDAAAGTQCPVTSRRICTTSADTLPALSGFATARSSAEVSRRIAGCASGMPS
jgi:hypothetical protein